MGSQVGFRDQLELGVEGFGLFSLHGFLYHPAALRSSRFSLKYGYPEIIKAECVYLTVNLGPRGIVNGGNGTHESMFEGYSDSSVRSPQRKWIRPEEEGDAEKTGKSTSHGSPPASIGGAFIDRKGPAKAENKSFA